MNHIQGSLLYEGKAKRVFACENPNRVLIEFKNDATAFNAKKRSEIEGKGRLNCKISAALFKLLESNGIPTHAVGQFPNRGNPHTITPQRQRYEWAAFPKVAQSITPIGRHCVTPEFLEGIYYYVITRNYPFIFRSF